MLYPSFFWLMFIGSMNPLSHRTWKIPFCFLTSNILFLVSFFVMGIFLITDPLRWDSPRALTRGKCWCLHHPMSKLFCLADIKNIDNIKPLIFFWSRFFLWIFIAPSLLHGTNPLHYIMESTRLIIGQSKGGWLMLMASLNNWQRYSISQYHFW